MVIEIFSLHKEAKLDHVWRERERYMYRYMLLMSTEPDTIYKMEPNPMPRIKLGFF